MFRITIGAVCLALLSSVAQAQPTPSTASGMFISPAGEPFRLTPGGPAPIKAWFDAADADHDGQLTFAEFLADHNRFFDVVDLDKSGVIAGAETTYYERRIAPEILGPDGPGRRLNIDPEKLRDMRMGGREPKQLSAESRTGAGRFALINEPQPIRAGDGDIDFQVTKAEWGAAARRRFNRLDTDKSTALTLPELEARLP